jgi:hypothetical protein
MPRFRSIVLAGALLGMALVGAPAAAETIEIGPDSDLCAAMLGLRAGDELVLRPGEYQGGCTIPQGGSPGAPVVIRGADPENRPKIIFDETEGDVLLVKASHVTLRRLEFPRTKRDVDVVRIQSGSGVTVEECRFVTARGIAVAANQTSLRGLVVRRNEILSSEATAMYFGCDDGISCVVSDILVERNYIRRVGAPNPQIGYGVEVKLNSQAVIRDNVIVETKGPGIMIFGSKDPARVSLVEKNLVIGSRQSSGILIGGGPVVVRNNIVVQNTEGGIGLQDYKNRGLLRGVTIVHNSSYLNDEGGILLPEKGVYDVTIVNNAAYSTAGKPSLPVRRPGLRMLGNVDCAYLVCFIDPRTGDFSPAFGSPLVGPGVTLDERWFPRDDYHGLPRGLVPTVGAIDRAGSGPVVIGIKN